MRVLVNGFGAYNGGVARVHSAVCREIAAEHSLDIANAPRGQEAPSGATVLTWQTESRLWSAIKDWLRPNFVIKYDVRVDSAPAPRPFTRAARRVTIVHDLNFLNRSIHGIGRMRAFYRWAILRATLSRCSKIVTVSEHTAVEVMKHLPSVAAKVVVARLPVDDSFRAHPRGGAAASSKGRGDREVLQLLSFGHAQNKGVHHIINLLDKYPDYRLELVCNEFEWRTFWRDAALFAGVETKISVTGRISDQDLIAAYMKADVVCMLSDYEGYGLPIAEALALGRPTVVSDLPILRDTSRGWALSVRPSDTRALDETIRAAAREPSSRWLTAAIEVGGHSWEEWTRRLLDTTA